MTESGAPVWLLDVDGVLNASKPGWSAAPRSASAWANGFEFNLRWSPAAMDRLRAMTPHIEIRWCTTWSGHTGQLEKLWDLPVLPDALGGQPLVPGEAAAAVKLTAALHVVQVEGRPLVWTDDEVIPKEGEERAILENAGSLLITPDSRRGLRPEHFDAINLWLQDVANSR